MADRELGEGSATRWQAAYRLDERRLAAGWLGALTALLALALWLSQLTMIWIVLFILGSAVWTLAMLRRPGRFGLTTAALLWLIGGIAGGVQYRLYEIENHWGQLQLGVEERAAAALGEALDNLVGDGERAVAGAAEAAQLHAGQAVSPALFDRLQLLQRAAGVSAIALYDADGATRAWAGEHRGMVPAAAREGTLSYLFHQGPLFSYLYFIRALPDGAVATAAFLLEANVDLEEGVVPFSELFERRHGTRPRFWLPERARAEAVWDWATDRPILSVTFAELTQQLWWERVAERGRRGAAAAGLVALLLLSAGWYRSRMQGSGVPVLVGMSALLIAPLGPIFDSEVLFSPLQFVLPGPLDVTLGVLLVLLLGVSLALLTRSEHTPSWTAPLWVTLPLLIFLFPLGLLAVQRSAADGLLARSAGGGFWLQLATALLVAVPIFVAMRYSRRPRTRWSELRVVRVIGYVLPALLGLGVLFWWRPAMPVPLLLSALWAVPSALMILTAERSGRLSLSLRRWLLAGWLAGTAALAFLWPLHVRADLTRAEREIALLGSQADTFLDFLLRQFAERSRALAAEGEDEVNLLYHSWVESGLGREGYEALITLWSGGEAVTELNLSELVSLPEAVIPAVQGVQGEAVVQHYAGSQDLNYLLIAPLDDGRTISVAVPPRRGLAWTTPLASLIEPDREVDARQSRETLYLVPVDPEVARPVHTASPMGPDTVHWVRTAEGWRSETVVEMPEGPVHAHLVVEASIMPLLLARAILVQTGIVLAFLVLWTLARAVCRDLAAVPLLPVGWLKSFRGRLSLALFFSFLLPTLAFGVISYGAVAREVVRSAAALAQQTLDQAARMTGAQLTHVASDLRADLLMYRQGTLTAATSPELLELGLFHAWLPPAVYIRFSGGENLQELEEQRLADSDYLVAYRRLDAATVLAAPIPLASHEITRRQLEFRDIALLVVMLGLGLSMMSALLVSRALARPLDELSRAASTVGAGNLRTPLPASRSDEFGSVYDSFNRMVQRLRRTRAALVQETRRTEAIVAEAATGVLALDANGRVELVNPRASEILGQQLRVGEPFVETDERPGPFAQGILDLWGSPTAESTAEVEANGRVVRMRLRRLSGAPGGGGAVIALEDVTAELRTARVLAWGEMARQVAHEIKNPLTPIKLAVQHMRRAFIDQKPDFDQILEKNVNAILLEIDRLGDIARAFSRFGTPAEVASPLEKVDVRQVIEEMLALYRGSEGPSNFRAELPDGTLPLAVARADELKEVLLNLLENARQAIDGEGGEVVVTAVLAEDRDRLAISVSDTGIGIPEDQLPRIFEPRFSTRSSGTGLGLAIVRRIVDSWGGEISAESAPGAGTRFEILLQAAPREEGEKG